MIEIRVSEWNYLCEDYCGYFGNAVIIPSDEDELYGCIVCGGYVNSEEYIWEMIGMGCREIEDYPEVALSMGGRTHE